MTTIRNSDKFGYFTRTKSSELTGHVLIFEMSKYVFHEPFRSNFPEFIALIIPVELFKYTVFLD